MKVRFYTGFSKRTNSTKQISSEAYTELDITWKEPTSIEKPIAIITGNHFDYTYCYVSSWNRYYFVDDITTVAEDLTQITMSEDYMASWKSNIGSTVAHIVYSSTGYDIDIVDPRIAEHTTKQWQEASAVGGGFGGGCFVLNSLSKASSGNSGFQSSYVLNSTDMKTLSDAFLDLDTTTWITNAVYNPMDCIVSCKWYPLDYSTIVSACTNGGGQGYIGSMPIGGNVPVVTTPVYTNNVTLSLTTRYNDFRRISSSKYQLFVPYAGVFPIAQDEIVSSGGALNIAYYIDLITGSMLIAEIGNGQLYNMFEIGFGVDCPLASVQGGNIGNFVQDAIGTVAGIGASIASGNIAGVVGSAAAGVTSATSKAITQRYRSRGTQGSRAYTYQGNYFRLIEDAWDTEDPDSANYIARQGRPVFETHAISNHSGYVQCEAASVTIAGLSSERDTINSLLNSGIYYE